MIKIVALAIADHPELDLRFSDGSHGRWSAAPLIARDATLTRALADPTYFARAFIEGGALAWPNGLELSPATLHVRMRENGSLLRQSGVAAE